MKPEASSPGLSPEQMPVQQAQNYERGLVVPSPENGIDKSAERYEQKSELGAITADVGITTVLPTPVVSDSTVVDDTTISSMPLIANDDDLIEKEWVDKAKKIVAETQNDPHKREEEVSKMQVEYIKKRFGRGLGAAE